jgi:hypothetical protein
MATILLGAAGSAIGSSIGGSLLGVTAAAWGRAAGATLGGLIDQKLSGSQNRTIESGKIDRFRLQNSVEGAPIGRVVGRNRIAGQVIWASDFFETISSQSSGGGKFNTQPTIRTDTYSYSISLALALCEGEIVKIGRIWADGLEISQSNLSMTTYTGTSDQEPDATIASFEGVDKTPSYNGTAYVVFENLQLADFGNRVPQFNFEVYRRAKPKNISKTAVNDLVKGVALMPGSGEYVLATTPVNYTDEYAVNQSANVHTNRGETDFVHSLEDLVSDLPNSNSTLLVSSWFGDDLRCGTCKLEPKVEQKLIDGGEMPWTVSGLSRWGAKEVSKEDDRPIFGGTPSDQSVLEAINALHAQGQEVVFYPFIMMDIQTGNGLSDPWGGAEQSVIPWRGRMTASLAPGQSGTPDKTLAMRGEVDAFFGNAQIGDFAPSAQTVIFNGDPQWSYRRFILHNAHLCALAGGVNAFCIGSELRGLTSLRDEANLFPVVEALMALATDVRQILGPNTNIGYAADWSEYFGYQPTDGSGDLFFNLDGLWAHSDIDFVGIDNYMPLSDWRDEADHLDAEWGNISNIDYLQANIEGGEGYDWYYANDYDREIQSRSDISDGAYDEPWVYRYKDIRNWWHQWHFNRIDGVRQESPTPWQPQSKPIWFTEYGFPAVDKGTNQPNVFIDPKSSESSAPYFSNLEQDPALQANGIRALVEYWEDNNNNPISSVYNSRMINMSKAHVWAWDARPWPDFPQRTSVWSDGENYELGHWLSGRLGGAELSLVVAEICEISGIEKYDVSALNAIVNGFWLKGQETAREALEVLMTAYNFSCTELQGELVFLPLSSGDVTTVFGGDLVADPENQDSFSITRNSRDTTIEHVSLGFWNSDREYQYGQVEARNYSINKPAQFRLELPLVLQNSEASKLVDRQLFQGSFAKETIEFTLPLSGFATTVGDIIEIDEISQIGRFRIDSIEEQGYRIVQATRIRSNQSVARGIANVTSVLPDIIAPNPVYARFLDLPKLADSDDGVGPYVGITANPWPGGAAVFIADNDSEYKVEFVTYDRTIFGRSLAELPRTHAHRWSERELHVSVTSGVLSSVSETKLLNGANLAAILDTTSGQWELFQYQFAELQSDGSYLLSRFLRGQYGTDAVIPDLYPIDSELVFLSDNTSQLDLVDATFQTVLQTRYGSSSLPLNSEYFKDEDVLISGTSLRPYSPAHVKYRKRENGDVDLFWSRRTRAVGDFWSAADVPLAEAAQTFRVSIYLGNEAIRSTNCNDPSHTYSQAEIAADGVFGVVEVGVAQISEIYGPGLETRISINV